MTLLRLDPDLPIVWRSPDTLQFGGQPPRLVLEAVAPHEERMIAALVVGVPPTGLAIVGRCRPEVAAAFLERLRPCLAVERIAACSYSVRARGVHHHLVGATARGLGLLARPAVIPPGRRAGIVVGSHAIPASDYRDWLRRDLPHVGIVFADDRVVVSHPVRPGATACLRCADLWQRDREPSWPLLATQLVDQPAAAALDPILRAEALATAARMLAEDVDQGARGFVLTAHGRVEQLPSAPHPECRCTVDLQRSTG